MSIDLFISSKEKDLGGGFIVRRALPVMQRRMVGPFIFFDHMGPVELEVGHGMDVRPHPHIGLSTLTYLFEGEAVHRDTLGFEQVIRPGAVNWMTSGRGIAHSERSAQEARAQRQRLHGIQTWLALPIEHEEVEPSFHHHPEKNIPEISFNGMKVKIIAGEFEGQRSPVAVFSPTTYLEVQLEKSKTFEMNGEGQDLAVYLVSGRILVNGTDLQVGQLAVLKSGARPQISCHENSRFLILGGKPFAEQRHVFWNFVSSRKERIEQAKQDWLEQRFGRIRGETEFIPLPAT